MTAPEPTTSDGAETREIIDLTERAGVVELPELTETELLALEPDATMVDADVAEKWAKLTTSEQRGHLLTALDGLRARGLIGDSGSRGHDGHPKVRVLPATAMILAARRAPVLVATCALTDRELLDSPRVHGVRDESSGADLCLLEQRAPGRPVRTYHLATAARTAGALAAWASLPVVRRRLRSDPARVIEISLHLGDALRRTRLTVSGTAPELELVVERGTAPSGPAMATDTHGVREAVRAALEHAFAAARDAS